MQPQEEQRRPVGKQQVGEDVHGAGKPMRVMSMLASALDKSARRAISSQ